jgi:formylglycine-generating enzyme
MRTPSFCLQPNMKHLTANLKTTLGFVLLLSTAFSFAQAPALPIKPEVILVQGGTFTMGSNTGRNNEKPRHPVTLSSYNIGKYPVTVGQYSAFCRATGRPMPDAPSWGWNDKHPMVNVSDDDAVAYCYWLGQEYGGNWRLPTEAEWEYAARGGGKSKGYLYSGSNDPRSIGWYADTARWQTNVVGRKKTNELGIYDMSGSVWEWCSDWYSDYVSSSQTNPKGPSSGTHYVVRGGSWYDDAYHCRSTYRNYMSPGYNDITTGFRVVLPHGTELFEAIQISAKFPGGETAWKNFLVENLQPDIPTENGAPAGTYRVVVTFRIDKDGTLSNIQAATNHGFGMEEEAKRVIKKSPKWVPATQNGRRVIMNYTQTLTFSVN